MVPLIFLICSIDKYGFQYAEDFNYEAYEEMMSEYFPVLARRSEKWSRLLKENTKVDKNLKGGHPHTDHYCTVTKF